MEHYTLQSQAIQNAFADLNADVANGVIPCPVASCPFKPIIVASAFAQVRPRILIDTVLSCGRLTAQFKFNICTIKPGTAELTTRPDHCIDNWLTG